MDPPVLHPAVLNDVQLLAECEVRRDRRRGPGGQHRNKVETAIIITHKPTGMRGTAAERRNQEQNRQAAVFRLRVNLALHVRTVRPAENLPSELWRRRCSGRRIQINPKHADFPALLAEALDVLAAHDMDVRKAAEILCITPSQLVRFLKLEARALEQVNRCRRERGLRAYR